MKISDLKVGDIIVTNTDSCEKIIFIDTSVIVTQDDTYFKETGKSCDGEEMLVSVRRLIKLEIP
jgi:hypothetical protein